jgi:hypothetical protein
MTDAITPAASELYAGPIKLSYYGGRVLEEPKFVSLYAGSYWKTAAGTRDRSKLSDCSESVPAGPHSTVWNEYGVSKGEFLGSATIPLAKSHRFVTERDVQSLVAGAIRRSGVAVPDGDTVYTVFLPPDVVLTHGDADSRKGLGGFHGSYVDPTSKKPVYYAAIVYAKQGNGVPFTRNPIDNITIAASHEWTEAVTDPDVNRGKLGWYNKRFGEVGDIPISAGFPLSSVWGRIDGCAVQKEWSNAEQEPVLTE